MVTEIFYILLGLVLIVAGANYMTEGASSVASRFRIPQIIIGLTVVAFGTSAPELTVSVFGSIAGNGGIAVGNVIGSNIFNCLAILGLTAVITPLPVERNSWRYDIPIAIFAGIALLLVTSDVWLEGTISTISRTEAAFLTIFGVLFISYTVFMGKKSIRETRQRKREEGNIPADKRHHVAIDIAMIIMGLSGLVLGGEFFVDNASKVASALGVSDTLIGLTLVSWGTSLPELATSAVAALKKNVGIAVGNVVGSNIFNVFFVLGIAGVVRPLTGLQFTTLDIFMQLLAIVLTYFAAVFFGKHRITRWEGAVMLAIFLGYNVYIISNAITL